MFSDLECDYINPIDLCNKLNTVSRGVAQLPLARFSIQSGKRHEIDLVDIISMPIPFPLSSLSLLLPHSSFSFPSHLSLLHHHEYASHLKTVRPPRNARPRLPHSLLPPLWTMDRFLVECSVGGV